MLYDNDIENTQLKQMESSTLIWLDAVFTDTWAEQNMMEIVSKKYSLHWNVTNLQESIVEMRGMYRPTKEAYRLSCEW